MDDEAFECNAENPQDPIDVPVPLVVKQCRTTSCTTMTSRDSGFCKPCEDRLLPQIESNVMRCISCPAKRICVHSTNEYGLCVLEMDVGSTPLNRSGVEDLVEEVIKTSQLMVRRYKRYIASQDPTNPDSRFDNFAKELKSWSSILVDTIEKYVNVKGWNKTNADKDVLTLKTKILRTLVGKQRGKKVIKVAVPTDLSEDDDVQLKTAEDVDNIDESNDATMEEDIKSLDALEKEFMGQEDDTES